MSDLGDLFARADPDTDQAVLLWGEGDDLRYAWTGLTKHEVLRILRNTIADIEADGAEAVAPHVRH